MCTINLGSHPTQLCATSTPPHPVDNRDWELRAEELKQRFVQSRAIAVDMESATIAANGFRFRVPYGTLLCVSDKPIHGELKLQVRVVVCVWEGGEEV